MRLISLELLVQTLREHSIDDVYAVLERLFLQEPIVIIDRDGKEIRTFYDEMEIYDYLEMLQEKVIAEEV
jgi:hypothetical protein